MTDSSTGGSARSQSSELIERLRRTTPPDQCYETRGQLGQGGMGAVLEVWEDALRRPLAKKTVRARHGAADPRLALRLMEEAQVTAQLTHPGVPPVHVLGVDAEGQPYFTMPVVRGHDLDKIYSLVRRGEEDWSVERALGVLQRVCETMAYAHSRGVIHRDLKPGNVMVGEFGEVYVMDWGLARLAGRADSRNVAAGPVSSLRGDLDPESSLHTVDGAAVGTPSYMPPEQARGDELDARADVYAAGAMLYTLLAGRPPYSEPHRQPRAEEVLARIAQGPPAPVALLAPDAPPALHAICAKAMERDPARRYADMREMAKDLGAFLERRVVRAYRTGPWIEFKMWVQRNRATASALAGVVFVAVAGAGLLAWSEKNKSEMEQDRNARIMGLADTKSAADLERQEDELWPASPERLAGLQRWVEEARALRGRVPYHQETRKLVAAGSSGAAEDRWLIDQLDQLVAKLDAFDGRIEALAARRDLAAGIEERSISGAQARTAWNEAVAAIGSSPKYDNLVLAPQLGLLPLGADPQSGLWEFWHVASGERPLRDPSSGRWTILPETGLVLVLVPGATVSLGSRLVDPPPSAASMSAAYKWLAGNSPAPHADFYAESDEPFQADVKLAPFFLAKHELTQAQYERVMGRNPSEFRAANRGGPTHPVERVSWFDARLALQRLGLELPTDAQWEHACRAGTASPFSFSVEDAGKCANIADATLARTVAGSTNGMSPEVVDGHAATAPVGSLLPNPFGLHDMHGNVWEWTLEPDGDGRPADGDGRRGAGLEGREGVIRGGSWYAYLKSARSAERYNYDKAGADQDLGVRALRAVQP